MTRSSCPLRSGNPAPRCGSIRCRVMVALRVKGASPLRTDLPAGALRRFRAAAVVGEHRGDVALQLLLATPDHLLKAPEAAALAQLLELPVRVEHERRPGEPPRRAGTGGVQADDEEGGAPEAEREPRVRGVGADRAVPLVVR